jgi:hypothetical protein
VCVAAVILLALILSTKADDGRRRTRARTNENKLANQLFQSGLARPLFLAYDETWTKGYDSTGPNATYNPSGIAITSGPYEKLDVLIVSFSDLKFYGTGATMLLGGINGPPQTLRAASGLPHQRISAFINSPGYTAGEGPGQGLNSTIVDPFADHDDFQNYLQAVKTAHPNIQVWLAMGGASASDASSAATWGAITSQNIRDIFVAYPLLDGLHLDIENNNINPDVFLSQCEMMANAMPKGKQFTLCIEILQACSPQNFAQYSSLWKSNPAELFDYVSVQFYNYGYPTDPTAEISTNNPVGGDLPALLRYGFSKHQICLGINPGPDTIGPPPPLNKPWISDMENTTAVLEYLMTNAFGGVTLWTIQRDSPGGNNGDTTIIPANNYTFDFQRAPQDGKTPEVGWNPPWPDAYTNKPAPSPPFADGAFGDLVVNIFTIT